MRKESLLWSIMTMAKCKNTKEGEKQFSHAFGVFERKIGRGLFYVLSVLGIAFFASAFIEFRGTPDFVFRAILGLFLIFFAIWGARR